MSTTFAAVDLETTGLNARTDAIIEVGAVIFRDGEILDEWESLVDPQRLLPEFITGLTGITQQMVDEAPLLGSLKPTIGRLLNGRPIVGHNVGFDLAFLNEERLAVGSHRLDTATLASIVLPEAGRYSLESVVSHLGLNDVAKGPQHRALADARRTAAVFMALQARTAELDFAALEEIVLAGQRLNWPETLFFEEALRQ
ncbi:MAG: 3'-5' exonuclease, partial [Candidatus Promineifilaceae bacterium]|nr:3'-5' exonuclease [Candidatus Promineifilaceae bacterium]